MAYLVVGRASPLPKRLITIPVPWWLWPWWQSSFIHERQTACCRRFTSSIAFLSAVAILLIRAMPIPVSVAVTISIPLSFAFTTRFLLLVSFTVPVAVTLAYALPLAMSIAPSLAVPVAIFLAFRVSRAPRTSFPCMALTFATVIVTTIPAMVSFWSPLIAIRPPTTACPTFHTRIPRTWPARG